MPKAISTPEGVEIGDHGAIGNMRTMALVSTKGTIDYFCHPQLDSPSVFCGLLDAGKGGAFSIKPADEDEWRTRQIYLPDTNVLVTRFMNRHAVFEIVDFMPVMREVGPVSALVRRVTSISGEVKLEARCAPRFDYARDGAPQLALDNDGARFTPNGRSDLGVLRLRSDVALKQLADGAAGATFTLAEKKTAFFVLECGIDLPTAEGALDDFVDTSFKETIAYWQSWAAHSTYRGRWREYVMRSALVLKLLSSAEHGSIAAAATFGLPEQPGGGRNWDYRFCWIRDAAFTVFALIRLGYVGEAQRFGDWIAARAALSEVGDFQILYRLDGGAEAPEHELDHLAGYGGARPVRIGNAAASQLQLDIYGALLDSTYLADKYGSYITYGAWEGIVRTLNWVCQNWDQPDEGIWEIRGEPRHFLSSRLMCWVALDRGLRVARKRSLPNEHAREWQKNRDLIYRDIHDNFWNAERGAFVQYKGGDRLDASALLMPLMRFIVPEDPRWLSTQAAIDRELTSDVLVKRYETAESGNVDGLDGEEGAFTPCCFWFVECLARSGQVSRARLHFEKLVTYANELGLFSEEIGAGGEQLGNTPQALTHLALISAAYTLNAALDDKGAPSAASWRQF